MAAQVLQRCAGARTAAACARRVRLAPTMAVAASAAAAAGRRRTTIAAATPSPQVPAAWAEAEPGSAMARFQESQRAAPRPTLAEDARTLMALARAAVLSTQSAAPAFAGHPFGSVVEFAVDEQGRPIMALSSLSSHTGDLRADGRCSLTVAPPGALGLDCARFTLVGTAAPVPEAERAAARDVYLKKYPNAYYVDFGDVSIFRLEPAAGGRYVGGFGRAGTVAADAYRGASPDPVAAFAGPVCGHMNADHQADLLAMVKHYLGVEAASAKMLDLDRSGFHAELVLAEGGAGGSDGGSGGGGSGGGGGGGAPIKARVPFPRPAEDRKAVKDVIVEMTRAARGAAAA